MPGGACSLRNDRPVATATVEMVGVDLSCEGRCYKLEKRGHTSGGRKNVSLLLVLASSTNTLYLNTAISERVLPQRGSALTQTSIRRERAASPVRKM